MVEISSSVEMGEMLILIKVETVCAEEDIVPGFSIVDGLNNSK